MKQKLSLTLWASLLLLFVAGCAANVKPLDAKYVKADPQPLELRGGKVPVTISINVPDKWFPKKATMRITPVLKYATGEAWGTEYRFQGESVRGNAVTVPYKGAQPIVIHSEFIFKPEMAVSDLVLMIEAKVGNKVIKLPDLKIGEGVQDTEALAKASYVTPAVAPDMFQRIIKEQYDADIKFLIQQANLRSSELNKGEVKEWKNVVESAEATPNQKVSVEVQAYASPDGGLELNEKLAAQREKNTTQQLTRDFKRKKIEVPVDAHYTAQDWEGFKELVEKSNIQDKDIVLRVLSMYQDPEVREREIKNISVVFKQLAEEILPQLRRSRLVATVEIIGKSDEEISKLAKENPGSLSLEELLYAASLTNDDARKKEIYTTTAQLYPQDSRALNNLGALAFKSGNYNEAHQTWERVRELDKRQSVVTPELQLNKGIEALMKNDLQAAETLIGQVSGVPVLNEARGLLYIKRGQYKEAAKELYNTATNNGVVAQILNKDYNRANELLRQMEDRDATTYYLQAILGARTGQNDLVEQSIREVVKHDPSLKMTLLNDKEFSKYTTQSFFQNLLK